jgi:hypothetical protein
MGGNAVKNDGFPVIRLDKKEYEPLKNTIMNFLRSIYLKENEWDDTYFLPQVPHTFEDKQSFGDIDILLDIDGLKSMDKSQLVEKMMNLFGVTQDTEINPDYVRSTVVKNGDAISVGLPIDYAEPKNGIFQVDLITSHTHYFDYNLNYFSWNDLGNLMGVIASKTNQLKHGHDGLHAMVRDGDNYLGTVELTVDFNKALMFLGYDPKRYHQGFQNLEEIYEYVATPKWFNPEYFADANRSHVQRIRDRKRSTYRGFLEWCQEQTQKGAFKDKILLDDDFWRNRVLEHFPEFKEKEKAIFERNDKRKLIKGFFNAKFIQEIKPELQGKDLGQYMEKLKHHFKTEDEFENFVLNNKEKTISLLINLVDTTKSPKVKWKP